MPEHKGWYSRNYLPHLDAPEMIQAITFRLADSLPQEVIDRLGQNKDPGKRSKIVEAALDRGHGSCCLRDPQVGGIVQDCLLWGDVDRYRLLAWVVMPNHVHVLIETVCGHPVPGVVQGWKSVSARRMNAALVRAGTMWQTDFYDRFVRDEAHYVAVVDYIENNPDKAGLVQRPEDWPLSSARLRRL
jgi:REP element-mobilizing transposase RayT